MLASVIHSIYRLYTEQKEVMEENTRVWFSLTLSYCCHSVSRLLRSCSQQVIELSYDHLLKKAEVVKSILSDVAVSLACDHHI